MKKLLLFSVACFLFAGSQMSFAQTEISSNVTSSNATVQGFAQENTNKVAKILAGTNKLESEQQKQVYAIFAAAERKRKAIDAITNDNIKIAKNAKMIEDINSKLKTVLTKQQFDVYLKNTVAR